MKKRQIFKPFRVLLKFSLLVGLSYSLYFSAEGKRISPHHELHNGKGLSLNDRMSKIEAENQENTAAISLLKTTVDEEKKSMARLEIKVDFGLNSISQLKSENIKQKTESSALENKIGQNRKVIEELGSRVVKQEAANLPNGSEIENKKDEARERFERPARLLPLQLIHGKKNKSEEAINREIAQFLGPPTSCSDLGKLGYTLNGYYLVKNKNSIVIDYCMFRQAQGLPTTSKQVLQTPIGNVEVKTRSVYFHVHMTENLDSGYIPFRSRDINVGGAMGEWKFTSPVAGTYHFQFFGIVHNPGSNFRISIGHHGHAWQYSEIKCQNCTTQFISMASTFHLDANYDIALYKPAGTGILAGGGFYDSYSYFTGWLVEEDLNLA